MLKTAISEQTRIPQMHMELFFDNHPFIPVSHSAKDLPITTVTKINITLRFMYCSGRSSDVLVWRAHL